MDRRLEEIKTVLKKYGQEHLLNQYENLDDVHKKMLLDQIESIDFELMQSLYQSTKKENKHGEDKIERYHFTAYQIPAGQRVRRRNIDHQANSRSHRCI